MGALLPESDCNYLLEHLEICERDRGPSWALLAYVLHDKIVNTEPCREPIERDIVVGGSQVSYAAGGGAELMVTNNISVGLEYLYTDLKDKDYVVNVGPGTAPPTNPFLLNGGGTDIQRSNPHFRTHSVRGSLSLRF